MSIDKRFMVVYRSERKRILRSQLHLIDYLQGVLAQVSQCKVKDDLPVQFQHATFTKTENEAKQLANESTNANEEGTTSDTSDETVSPNQIQA